jgi:hypothetical protein
MPIRRELRHLYKTPEYKAARAACRERAQDKCEQCGGGNREIGWKVDGKFVRLGLGRVLPKGTMYLLIQIQCGCAHLDNNPANNAPENLAWLCRGCHLHRDAPFHRLTRQARKDAARPLLAEAWQWGAMFEQLAEGGTCAPRETKESNDDNAGV